MDRLAQGRANRAIRDDFTACSCSDLPLLLCHRFKRDNEFVINLKPGTLPGFFLPEAG